MIKIPEISVENKELFFNDVKDRYISILKDIKHNPVYRKLVNYIYVKGQISENRIRKIIIGDRVELNNIIQIVGIIRRKDDETVYKCFENEYKKFSRRAFGHDWAKRIGVKICPYCNRSFIYTLSNGTRPQYDHFYPKSLYPYLSISLYNLIPCCSICNNSKKDEDVYQKSSSILYPFEDEYGYDISFRLDANDVLSYVGMSDNFFLKIQANEGVNEELKQRVENTINKLHTEDLYNLHKDYVTKLLKSKYIFSDDYCESLVKSYPLFFSNVDEVKDQLYFNCLKKEEWGEQILSKLTYDILNSD